MTDPIPEPLRVDGDDLPAQLPEVLHYEFCHGETFDAADGECPGWSAHAESVRSAYRSIAERVTARTVHTHRPVHNHGPHDGPGLSCREQLIGECQLREDPR